MDDLRVGAVFRAVRRRLNIRQIDVATRAGVHQTVVSRIERGHLAEVSVAKIRAAAAILEIHLPFAPRWRGAELPRLLDQAHARLVEAIAAYLAARGWHLVPEYTYSVYGERGAIDLVAWHPAKRALLLVEVKTAVTDVQDLLAQKHRRLRVVPRLLRNQHGWHPQVVGYVLVLPEGSASRSLVRRHAAVFAATFPARWSDFRTWLQNPAGELSAVWFLSRKQQPHAKRQPRTPTRIRRLGRRGSERGMHPADD